MATIVFLIDLFMCAIFGMTIFAISIVSGCRDGISLKIAVVNSVKGFVLLLLIMLITGKMI